MKGALGCGSPYITFRSGSILNFRGYYYRFFFAFSCRVGVCSSSQHGGCTMDFQKELIAEYDRETAKTRKMLDAIPADFDKALETSHQVDDAGKACWPCVRDGGGLGQPHAHHRQAGISARPQVGALTFRRRKEALLERFDKDVAGKGELAKFPVEGWNGNWKFVAGGQPGSTTRSTASGASGC